MSEGAPSFILIDTLFDSLYNPIETEAICPTPQSIMKGKVYIAGPYTDGDTAVNVRKAFEIANELADNGFAPFVPHYTHFWHMLFPRPKEFWLKLDREYLKSCDCVFRIEGNSKGADEEEKFARALGIPVFYCVEEVIEHFKER